MPKRRAYDDRKRLDPEDVLAGRTKLSAVDLIHWVNPTGPDLPAREADLRYTQNSGLQSLIILRFGPDLSVVADPTDGTVAIFHRSHGRDGCHAVLDALDEDARSWVRLQFDLGGGGCQWLATRPGSRSAARYAPLAARPTLGQV